jgi:hypothetical protein
MRTTCVLTIHFFVTVAKLLGSGGARAVIAEGMMMKQQLIVLNRPRKRGPSPTTLERFLFGFWTLLISPKRTIFEGKFP